MSIRSITSAATKVSFIFIWLLALPSLASASVIISEVMYDPPGTNAKQSWFELYNDGTEAVDISKWSMTDGAKGTSGALTKHAFNVPPKNGGIGSAVIPAGGYVIIADDAATFIASNSSVQNVIDTVFSISNPSSGAEIRLLDALGNALDSLSFSADQYASNKGNSLQRSGGVLVSALPTPAAPNATQAYVPPETDNESSSGSVSSKTPSSSYVPAPAPTVFADGGADRIVIVGADTAFRAQAYNRDQATLKSAKFLWTFGDGASSEGALVMHHFSYPGRYAVELYITNQNYSGSSRIIITAKEAAVGMSMLAGGGVSIQNLSDRDLDLSYWLVRQGAVTFRLPEHSVVLKGEAINIDQATLGFAAVDAKLLYPNETEVALVSAAALVSPQATPPESLQTAASLEVELDEPVSTLPSKPDQEAPGVILMTPVSTVEATSTPASVESQAPAQSELAASVIESGTALPLWTALAGLGGIVGMGVMSVYAVRRRPETPTAPEEFTIE